MRLRGALTTYKLLAVLVACNYFAFRVELFEREDKENHQPLYQSVSITSPSTTWETFDKDNAPQAIVVNPNFRVEHLFNLTETDHEQPTNYGFSSLVRDKSPPVLISNA